MDLKKISALSDEELLELSNGVQTEMAARNKTTNIIASLRALQDACAANLSENEYVVLRVFKDKSGSLAYGHFYDHVHLYNIEKEAIVRWEARFNESSQQ